MISGIILATGESKRMGELKNFCPLGITQSSKLRLLEHLFPERKDLFQEMEAVDLWLVLALLCLFGVYTLIIVGIRLFRGLWIELRGGQSKKGDDEND